MGMDSVLTNIAQNDCDVRSWTFGKVVLRRLGEDAAMLLYSAEQDATCGGIDLPRRVMATSIYVHRDGKWRSDAYHETGIAE